MSKIKMFLFTCRGFCLTLQAEFFSTNDEWRHRTRGVARNCPWLCSLVSLSFWSRWLPLFVGFFCLTLYQWLSLPPYLCCDFSVVAWSVRADFSKLDIGLFFLLLVYFPLFVLSLLCSSSRVFSHLPVSPICSLQYTRHHSSCVVSGTPAHLVLVALPCLLGVPAGAWGWCGDTRLSQLCTSSLLGYSFRDSLHIWDNYLTVLCPTVGLFLLFLRCVWPFPRPRMDSHLLFMLLLGVLYLPSCPPPLCGIVSHLFMSILTFW